MNNTAFKWLWGICIPISHTLIQLYIFSEIIAFHTPSKNGLHPLPLRPKTVSVIRSSHSPRSEGCARIVQLVWPYGERGVKRINGGRFTLFSPTHLHIRFNFHLERSHKTLSTSKCVSFPWLEPASQQFRIFAEGGHTKRVFRPPDQKVIECELACSDIVTKPTHTANGKWSANVACACWPEKCSLTFGFPYAEYLTWLNLHKCAMIWVLLLKAPPFTGLMCVCAKSEAQHFCVWASFANRRATCDETKR